MKYLILAIFALVATGCASVPKTCDLPIHRHYYGTCSHPAINSGAPFKVANDSQYEDGLLKIFFEGGDFVELSGAQCVLKEQTP